MKQTTLFVAALFAFVFAIILPLGAEEEKIQLPDVTTTVTGDSLTAGKNAIPDFTVTLPTTDSGSVPLPQLPGAKSETVAQEPEADLSAATEKAIYAEGLIGGGYPGFFSGDFSIYKSSGDNPFLLRFFHESANGYGLHKAADGYFDNKTELSGTKQITFKNMVFNLGASYATASNGMQSLSTCFFDTTQQTIGSSDSVKWNLPYGFSIALAGEGDVYSRYAGLIPGTITLYTLQEAGASVVTLQPQVTFAWTNETTAKKGVSVDFTMQYIEEAFLSNTEYSAPEGSSGLEIPATQKIHHGQFGLNASWSNAIITIDGSSAIVVGYNDGTGSSSSFIVAPFALGIATHFATSDASRQIVLSAKGGLDSYLPKYADLEKKYAWTAQDYLPSETSDWFATVKATVPFASSFNFDASGEFRKTALGNGVWEPAYNTISSTGLYSFTEVDRTLVDSDIGFSFLWKLLTVKADWKSQWAYVPVTEEQYSVGVTGNVQAADGSWGAELALREALGTDDDHVPVLNASGFYRLNDSIRLALQLDDGVKLLTGTNRMYANTQYLSRAGSVTLLVKFFF